MRIRIRWPITLTKEDIEKKDNQDESPLSSEQREQDSWLRDVLKRDIESLKSGKGRRIYYLRWLPDYGGITKNEPYFDVSILALNATVLDLLVDGVGGVLNIEDEDCARAIEFIKENQPIEIKHAEYDWIKIRQHITTIEKAKEIMVKGQKKQLRMNFNNCYLIVRLQIPGTQTEPINVSLGGNIQLIDYTGPPLTSELII